MKRLFCEYRSFFFELFEFFSSFSCQNLCSKFVCICIYVKQLPSLSYITLMYQYVVLSDWHLARPGSNIAYGSVWLQKQLLQHFYRNTKQF